jgi:hypothetical protein
MKLPTIFHPFRERFQFIAMEKWKLSGHSQNLKDESLSESISNYVWDVPDNNNKPNGARVNRLGRKAEVG